MFWRGLLIGYGELKVWKSEWSFWKQIHAMICVVIFVRLLHFARSSSLRLQLWVVVRGVGPLAPSLCLFFPHSPVSSLSPKTHTHIRLIGDSKLPLGVSECMCVCVCCLGLYSCFTQWLLGWIPAAWNEIQHGWLIGSECGCTQIKD